MWVSLPILSPDLRVDTIFPSTRSVCDVSDSYDIAKEMRYSADKRWRGRDAQLNRNYCKQYQCLSGMQKA